MVLGRAGMKLEAQKFAVYLMIPITASLAFNEPSVQKWAADYFQFMKYPANPNTNLKEEYKELKKQRDEEIEWEKKIAEKREKGRAEYAKQLKQLSAANARGSDDVNDADTIGQRRGWFGWLRWNRGNTNGQKDI